MKDCKTIFTVERLTQDMLDSMGVRGVMKLRLPSANAVRSAQVICSRATVAGKGRYATRREEDNVLVIYRL